jgi:hypothetical protein
MAIIKVWDGTSWIFPFFKKTRIWNGSDWVYSNAKYWNGTAWAESSLTTTTNTFNAGQSGTIIAPSNAFSVTIKVWGGGGPGASVVGGFGGGGGGGSFSQKSLSVVGGVTSFTYYVASTTEITSYGDGAPFPGNPSGITGGADITAYGGNGGFNSTAGSGGFATGGDINLSGNDGVGTIGGSGANGGGAGGFFSGQAGTAPGGGGAGGQDDIGGRGAGGRIIFEWLVGE